MSRKLIFADNVADRRKPRPSCWLGGTFIPAYTEAEIINTYVSCSPFRVPVARLAAAQAAVG